MHSLTYYKKKTTEKQQQIFENFQDMKRNAKKLAPIAAVSVTAALTAGVLGWYLADSRPLPADIRAAAPEVRAEAAPLDLNAATQEELEELPEIGPVLAERIMDWRAENGPFDGPEDVMAVPGVGPAVYEAIAPYIGAEQEDGS